MTMIPPSVDKLPLPSPACPPGSLRPEGVPEIDCQKMCRVIDSVVSRDLGDSPSLAVEELQSLGRA